MQYSNLGIITTALLILSSCGVKNDSLQISVENKLDVKRSFETIAIPLNQIPYDVNDSTKTIAVVNTATNDTLVSQLVDEDGDSSLDMVLFQPEIAANSTNTYTLIPVAKKTVTDSVDPLAYSRFVPERTDDYAWENDRVAFRTYGPVAQQMVEDSVPGGTLTSGIDAWLKRVDYPIINEWYKKTMSGAGTYHEDTGEGLDNFHVGASRGIGGIAVKKDTTFYYSKNFTNWKTLSTGPLRTSFILEYADWDAGGSTITEHKKITLDRGSYFSKFEINLTGADSVSAGLTLHNNTGNTVVNEDLGYISYWETLDDSEIGSAILVPNNLLSTQKYISTKTDESNLYATIKPEDNTVTYYAGFGWKKRGEFTTEEEWKAFLERTAKKLKSPLKVNYLN
mgnify:CR=1 FL=1